jgi:hypothetical protein
VPESPASSAGIGIRVRSIDVVVIRLTSIVSA